MFAIPVTLPNGVIYDQPIGLFIGNEFVAGSAERIETTDPYTSRRICAVEAASPDDVDRVVEVSEKAFSSWKEVSGAERGRLLNKLADLMERDSDLLAAIEATDNGKAFHLAKAVDVEGTVSCLRYFAGWSDKVFGQVVETGPNSLNFVRHEPLGVVGQIIPWNFPLLIWAWKIGPAVACGNVCIIKSAEQTPLSALYAAKLVKEAGFPPGVINVLSGLGAVTGQAMSSHMRIRKLAFTGSTPVGRMIMKAAAESNLKRVTLELGGKSPNIVFADADFDQAVESVAMGIFFNHGQNCCAGSRAFVEASIYDRFLEALKERVSKIKVGDPFDPETFQGPQVSQLQFDRIMGIIEAGKKDGATLVTGGHQHDLGGLFVQPTIFADVSDGSPLREEIFGPVLCVSRFESVGQVIQQANDTEYGLASGVHTRDINKAIKFANELEAGVVWVNQYGALPAQLPMGGYKQSGIGRDLGAHALAEYTQTKTVQIAVGQI